MGMNLSRRSDGKRRTHARGLRNGLGDVGGQGGNRPTEELVGDYLSGVDHGVEELGYVALWVAQSAQKIRVVLRDG